MSDTTINVIYDLQRSIVKLRDTNLLASLCYYFPTSHQIGAYIQDQGKLGWYYQCSEYTKKNPGLAEECFTRKVFYDPGDNGNPPVFFPETHCYVDLKDGLTGDPIKRWFGKPVVLSLVDGGLFDIDWSRLFQGLEITKDPDVVRQFISTLVSGNATPTEIMTALRTYPAINDLTGIKLIRNHLGGWKATLNGNEFDINLLIGLLAKPLPNLGDQGKEGE